MFSVLERHGIALRTVRGSTATIWNAVQEIKEMLAPAGRILVPALKPLSKGPLPDEKADVWADIFEEIIRFQGSNRLLTFSDFIYLTVKDLASDRSKRIVLQRSHDALLIDEFQDLNASQHQFLSLLMGVNDSVYVVADDDQMIYGWRERPCSTSETSLDVSLGARRSPSRRTTDPPGESCATPNY